MKEFVTQRVRLLFGCYRKGEAADAGVYTVAVASVLLGYPEDIIRSVTEPATGLPAKLQWLPTVAEVKGECERLMSLRYPPERLKALPEPDFKRDDQATRDAAVAGWEAFKAERAKQSPADIAREVEAAEARLVEARQSPSALSFSKEMKAKLSGDAAFQEYLRQRGERAA